MWLTKENTSPNVQAETMNKVTKLTWKLDGKVRYNAYYAIEKRGNGFWRVFDRLGRRLVTSTAPTLPIAKIYAQQDLDATNLNTR